MPGCFCIIGPWRYHILTLRAWTDRNSAEVWQLLERLLSPHLVCKALKGNERSWYDWWRLYLAVVNPGSTSLHQWERLKQVWAGLRLTSLSMKIPKLLWTCPAGDTKAKRNPLHQVYENRALTAFLGSASVVRSPMVEVQTVGRSFCCHGSQVVENNRLQAHGPLIGDWGLGGPVLKSNPSCMRRISLQKLNWFYFIAISQDLLIDCISRSADVWSC